MRNRAVAVPWCTAALLAVTFACPALGQTTLSIFLVGGPEQHPPQVWEAYESWLKEALGDGVSVEWLFGNHETLQTLIAGGLGPDAWQVYAGPRVAEFARSGVALDLTRYIEADGDYWYLPALGDGYVDGRYYALTFNLAHLGDFVYNRRLFEEAGLTEPDFSFTTDDMLAAAQRIARDTNGDGENDIWGVWGIESFRTMVQFVWGAGGDLIDLAVGKNALGKSDGSIRVLEWILDARQRGITDPSPGIWQSGFLSGRTAMIPGVGSTWGGGFVSYAQEGFSVASDLGKSVLPLDPITGERRIWGLGGLIFMVNARSEHPDLAWRALKTLADKNLEVERMKGAVPSISAVAWHHQEMFRDLAYFQGSEQNRDALLEASKWIRAYTVPNSDLERVYTAEWQSVLNLEKPIAAMVEELDRLVPALF